MSTINFKDAAVNPSLVADFQAGRDILLFTDISAASLTYQGGVFQFGTQSVDIHYDITTFTSGPDGFLRFSDGSKFLVGDLSITNVGDPLANVIVADASIGDDLIFGLSGNDTLNGGLGNDRIYGNTGNDYIGNVSNLNFPMAFDETIASGNDTVFGGQGNDYIYYLNGVGAALIYGNLGNDTIFGSDGLTTLFGGNGNDWIEANDGNDYVSGGNDNDTIYSHGGSDTLFGGTGNDSLSIATEAEGNSVVYGNSENDIIALGSNGDTAFGGAGNDTIISRGGDDLIYANSGADLIIVEGSSYVPPFPGPEAYTISGASVAVYGGPGIDTLSVEDLGADSVYFYRGQDDDVVSLQSVTASQLAANAYGGAITDTDNRGNLLKASSIILSDGLGKVVLGFGAGSTLDADNLKLSDGTVFVYNVGGAAGSFAGGSDDDFMIAGDNGDTLTAGAGADTLIGGDGNDLFVFGVNAGSDNVQGGLGTDSLTATVDGENGFGQVTQSIEDFTFTWGSGTGNAAINLTQSEGLRVHATSFTVGQNVGINAEEVYGNVLIETGTGDDTLFGSAVTVGGDTLAGGDGTDYIRGLEGNDLINGGAGTDVIQGDTGADTLTGGAGADQFIFNDGDSGFTTATVDHISDFNANGDMVIFDGVAEALFDKRLVDLSGSSDLADAASDAYESASGIAANDVVLFTFGGRTYAFVNNESLGFSISHDLLVDITGFTGTLSAENFGIPV